MQGSRLRIVLVVGAFFLMACSCRGCFLSHYKATIYAEDGVTELADGYASSRHMAIRSACAEYCRAQEPPEGEAEEEASGCALRCRDGAGPEVEVRWDGWGAMWDLFFKSLGAILKRSCQG